MVAAAQHRFPRARPRFPAWLALAACLFAAGCTRQSPEQQVRARIVALQQAIDARDAGDVDAMLADDFIGNEGIDKRGARQLAAGMFLRYRDVSAKLGPATVELRGERDAVARFGVLATAGSGGLLPDDGQIYEVETGWREVDGEWMLRNAEWKPKL
jgi:hypothetical protein